MNLSDYLSELLGMHDEVSVPGLGYFVRERINGYYNDRDARFYPPAHRVNFVDELRDDDTFTQYVADKKNISLASSKYFAEKFISKLREDASKGTYIFAELGQFYTQHDRLYFKAYDRIAADPAFYGYPAINVYKLSDPSFKLPAETYVPKPEPHPIPAPAPVITEVVAPPPPVTHVPVYETPPAKQQEYYEEEDGRKRGVSLWAWLSIAFIVICIGAFAVFRMFPEKVKAEYQKYISPYIKTAPVKKPGLSDSAKKAIAAAADTVIKTDPIDTIKLGRCEIIAGSFTNAPLAEAAVMRLKARGVADAKVLTKEDVPGNRFKISAGTFTTSKEADSVMKVLIKEKKIGNKSYPLPIKK